MPRGRLENLQPLCTSRRVSEVLLRTYAAEIGIAPGILVGHLQQLGWIPGTWCNQLERHLGWAPPGTEADPQVY